VHPLSGYNRSAASTGSGQMAGKAYQVNGLSIHAVVQGSPTAENTVVLLHGFPDSSKLWDKQVCCGVLFVAFLLALNCTANIA